MTGPIKFNPFLGVNNVQQTEKAENKNNDVQNQDTDLSKMQVSMNPGQDEEGIVNLENFDLNMKKELPKQ